MARILIHTLVFPPDANSGAYVVADLAKELQARGHTLTVLTTTPHYNLLEEALAEQPLVRARGRWLLRSDYHGVTCHHVRVPPIKGGLRTRLKTALRFHVLGLAAVLALPEKQDVVLSQSPPLSVGLVGAWIARLRRGKSIYIVQDVFPDASIRQGKIRSRSLIWALRRLERRVYSSSDAVCGISDGVVRTLRPRVPSRVALRTIPNFADTTLYRPLPRSSAFARQRGLDGKFVVSYAGNIGNAQDFGPLLAAARACTDLPIVFVIAGGGIKVPALQEEIRRDGLANVQFWGYLAREETPWLNACSDVTLALLSPHIGSFSFPSKLYTLMASGRPIVLVGDPESDAARLLSQTSAGWVVPTGDETRFTELIRELYSDQGSLAAAGRRGTELVQERYSVGAVAGQYEDLIANLLGSRA